MLTAVAPSPACSVRFGTDRARSPHHPRALACALETARSRRGHTSVPLHVVGATIRLCP
ncbi:hypothetical protein B0H34DRAFT_724212 [Crassisporium funariophilum]|nr:hypothetical protein B0H34DRAFT_724212 [Crassisporium funariophilum]